jgi:hypothetical protein
VVEATAGPATSLGPSVRIGTGAPLQRIDPRYFGVSTDGHHESPWARSHYPVADLLRDLGCRMVRFPGGTESDNYLWDVHRWWDPRTYPGSMDMQSAASSTDSWMAFASEVGAETFMVANTRIAAFEGVDRGAQLAAAWVRYCRERNYPAPIWEVGNEPYYMHYLTAAEYAEAFVKYAQAMKAQNPDIIVAAVGEKPDWRGCKDRVVAEHRQEAPDLERRADSGDVEAKRLLESYRTWSQTAPRWWDVVLGRAIGSLDAVSVHWYFDPAKELASMDATVRELRAMVDARANGRHIPIYCTEWNVSEWDNTPGWQRALMLAEAACRLNDGGVELGAVWPFRCGGIHSLKSMVDWTTLAPTPNYYAYQVLPSTVGDQRVKTTAEGVYAFASRRPGGDVVCWLVNRSGAALEGLRVACPGATEVTATSLAAQDPQHPEGNGVTRATLPVAPAGDTWEVDVPPWSLTTVRLRLGSK